MMSRHTNVSGKEGSAPAMLDDDIDRKVRAFQRSKSAVGNSQYITGNKSIVQRKKKPAHGKDVICQQAMLVSADTSLTGKARATSYTGQEPPVWSELVKTMSRKENGRNSTTSGPRYGSPTPVSFTVSSLSSPGLTHDSNSPDYRIKAFKQITPRQTDDAIIDYTPQLPRQPANMTGERRHLTGDLTSQFVEIVGQFLVEETCHSGVGDLMDYTMNATGARTSAASLLDDDINKFEFNTVVTPEPQLAAAALTNITTKSARHIIPTVDTHVMDSGNHEFTFPTLMAVTMHHSETTTPKANPSNIWSQALGYMQPLVKTVRAGFLLLLAWWQQAA